MDIWLHLSVLWLTTSYPPSFHHTSWFWPPDQTPTTWSLQFCPGCHLPLSLSSFFIQTWTPWLNFYLSHKHSWFLAPLPYLCTFPANNQSEERPWRRVALDNCHNPTASQLCSRDCAPLVEMHIPGLVANNSKSTVLNYRYPSPVSIMFSFSVHSLHLNPNTDYSPRGLFLIPSPQLKQMALPPM